MAWPKGRPRKIEQGNSAEPEPELPVVEIPLPQDLEGFIEHCERAHIRSGGVVVALKHPAIKEPRHRDGIYSGFTMAPGPVWCQWSDGGTLGNSADTD